MEASQRFFDEFGIDALVAPMQYPEISDMPMTTGSQRQKVANDLIREGKRAVCVLWKSGARCETASRLECSLPDQMDSDVVR